MAVRMLDVDEVADLLRGRRLGASLSGRVIMCPASLRSSSKAVRSPHPLHEAQG